MPGLLVAMGLLLGLIACTPQTATPQTQPELRIGLIVPLTGDYAITTGQAIVNAANLAVQQVNDAGGLEVGGERYQVRLIVEDDKDTAEGAVAAANKLINQDQVDVIVGVPFSASAIPVSEVTEEAKIPLISTHSTNPETTSGKKYAFRVIFIDPIQAQVLARFAHEELGARRAAILYDVSDEYSRGLAEAFRAALEQAGGEVVATESFTSDANKDFTEQLTAIKESEPDVLFLPNCPTELMVQVPQAREMGIDAQIIGSDCWPPTNEQLASETTFEDAFYSVAYHPAMAETDPRAKEFVEAFQAAYGEAPTDVNALAYDAVSMVFEAVRRQGKTDPESIREGVASLREYHGVSGTISYSEGGDPLRSAVIMQIQNQAPQFYQIVQPEP